MRKHDWLFFCVLMLVIGVGCLTMAIERQHRVKWGDDFPHAANTHNYFIMLAPDGQHRFEVGMRADGVLVWRELK